jgi:deazaflavin-dependent oxidoreductase (nitroreductase family)
MIRYDYVKTRREDLKPYPESTKGLSRLLIKTYTRINVRVYRASNGRWMNTFPGGFPICLVTTTGAKSGKERRIALIHLPLGEKKLIVASQGGADTHPTWYHNVKAHPEVEIQVGAERRRYLARQVSDEEKRELWPHLLSIYPAFDEYQARTDRNIPVFLCEPVE